jgi:tetratricopeptide (TPR) repeat protein
MICGGLALFFAGCAPQKKPSPLPVARTAEAREYFVAGELEKAIEAYEAARQKYPDEEPILEEYVLALEKIKTQADRGYDAGEFAAAERGYGLLLSNFSRFSGFEPSLSFTRPALQQRVLDCRKNLSQRKASQSLRVGDFQGAIDIYLVYLAEAPSAPVLRAGLLRTIAEVKRLADEALARKEFVKAGKGYSVLRKNYPWAQKAAPPLPFSLEIVERGFGSCRTELTRRGLDLYRKGKLKEAIACWLGLLEFDPENAEIKRAVETATRQLKELKKDL